MAKRRPGSSYDLLILNALMTHNRPLSTNQLCDLVGCERKTVYKAIDNLECSGFGVIVEPSLDHVQPNTYKFNGIFGV